MDHEEFRKRLKAEIRRRSELPWEEGIKPLVERGIVDEDGKPTYMLPDLSQPPPPPDKPNRRAKARADARTKPAKKKAKRGPA